MSRQLLSQIALISILSPLVGCSFNQVNLEVSPSSSVGVDGETIVLSDIDFDSESRIRKFQPVADYLAANLADVGITQGEVQVAPDVDTLSTWMASGEVGVYIDSVYPAMIMMERSGAIPILRRWKDGVSEYNTLFIARRDSGLTNLLSIQGKMIALQKPESTSGFMFPIVSMLDVGLTPVEKAEPNHPVASDQVGYVFSGRDRTTVEWVLNGKVHVGALDNQAFQELSEEDRDQLVILDKTDMFPRQVVLVSPELKPEQVEAVKTVLIDMDESKAGQVILADFSDTAQFDQFPGGAEAAIAQLQGVYQQLQTYLSTQQVQP